MKYQGISKSKPYIFTCMFICRWWVDQLSGWQILYLALFLDYRESVFLIRYLSKCYIPSLVKVTLFLVTERNLLWMSNCFLQFGGTWFEYIHFLLLHFATPTHFGSKYCQIYSLPFIWQLKSLVTLLIACCIRAILKLIYFICKEILKYTDSDNQKIRSDYWCIMYIYM